MIQIVFCENYIVSWESNHKMQDFNNYESTWFHLFFPLSRRVLLEGSSPLHPTSSTYWLGLNMSQLKAGILAWIQLQRASGIFRHSSYTHCQPMKQPSYFFPTPLLFYLHFPSYVLAYINTPGHSLGGEFSTLWSFAKVMVKALENLSTLWPRLWNFPDFGKLQKASPRMWIHLGGHCVVLSLPMEDETMQDHGARHCSIGVHYRAIEPAISRYRPIHGAFFFTSWCIICSWAPIFIHIIRLISRILHNLEPFHSFPL